MKPEPETDVSEELAVQLEAYLADNGSDVQSLRYCQDAVTEKARGLLELIRSSSPPPCDESK